MGQEKTMDFITDLILEHMKEIGEDRVFVVCMDGVGIFPRSRDDCGVQASSRILST